VRRTIPRTKIAAATVPIIKTVDVTSFPTDVGTIFVIGVIVERRDVEERELCCGNNGDIEDDCGGGGTIGPFDSSGIGFDAPLTQ
jgi:hypothetical protein